MLMLALPFSLDAQETDSTSIDKLSLGYEQQVSLSGSSFSAVKVGTEVLQNSPEMDIMKALYGKMAGLNVYQGQGRPSDNHVSFNMHGHQPLVLVDGYPRDVNLLTTTEIESVTLLKDAVATALYGIRGANGVLLITTKRGGDHKLKVTAKYQFGLSTQFRSPEFADAYTYGNKLNEALKLDGLDARYTDRELLMFQSGQNPNTYPNVNWWDEVYRKTGTNHQLDLTFSGGNERFRYFTSIDYAHDMAMFDYRNEDNRYSTDPADVRLNIRTNLDVTITNSTWLKLGVLGRLQDVNSSRLVDPVYSSVYKTPSAAFPIRTESGILGGNKIYGANNPVGLLGSSGHYRVSYGTLLADMSLKQGLDFLTKGLSTTFSIAFDNSGNMYESSTREYRYMDMRARMLNDGTIVTDPIIYGKDSKTLEHPQGFSGLYLSSDFQAKVAYERVFGRHNVNAALIYNQQSYVADIRNNSKKRQSMLATAGYSYLDRYVLNAVVNHSGTAYLPKDDRYITYPAVSGAWILSKENFMKGVEFIDWLKISASYGLSGWDGNLSHELYRQGYGNTNAGSYYFGDNISSAWGQSEGDLPVENLTAEKSEKVTIGIDLAAFNNRLTFQATGYSERRSNILVTSSTSVSGIIGIGVGALNAGIYDYKGVDLSLGWKDRKGDFGYGLTGNMSLMTSEIINDNQAFQEYDYLYTKGNKVGQRYGLEALGFFRDQMEINDSPLHTFSVVRPGDIRYKDQNGDNRIDDKDMVKMFGTGSPTLYYGINLNLSYKRLELLADFQGVSGMTVNLRSSPLYAPLSNNGNISTTFLDRETSWTFENRATATMPRLTTLENANNYRNSSLWYRDASFLKLRNLQIAYTLPKSLLRLAEMKVYVQGTNLFSIDNIDFADPEQLGATYPALRSYWAGVKFNF